LHIATKLYIDDIYVQSKLNNLNDQKILIDIVGSNVNNNTSIPIKVLDYFAFIPLYIYIWLTIIGISMNLKNMFIFHKTMIIGSILAILKGTLDMVTIIPDSSGISVCKNRLTTEQFEYLHTINFNDDFMGSLHLCTFKTPIFLKVFYFLNIIKN
jgi:hypothetical protein